MRTVALGLVCAFALVASAQSPDNSKANRRDEGKATAEQQGNSAKDIEITKEIRREITSAESMSTYAKNIKIITKDGFVTLRGPVKTAEERTAIEQFAKRVAGDAKVKNELEVSK
jgi:osmotically-inducible protein OsmY